MDIEEDANQLRPSLSQIQTKLRRIKQITWISAISVFLIYYVILPVAFVSLDDFSSASFQGWLITGFIFSLLSFVYFLIGPISEVFFFKFIYAAKRSLRFFKSSVSAAEIPRIEYEYYEGVIND